MGNDRASARKSARTQRRSSPLWLWPAVSGIAGFVVGTASSALPIDPDGWITYVGWPGDSASALTLVQAVAASAITVTTLTFSLTVLTLQLASQQFSPRLLRHFTRDPVTRVVLSVLVATFTLSIGVIRELRSDQEPPALGMLAVTVMGLLSLATLLGFITHIVRNLRIDSILRAVHEDTTRALERLYPRHDDERQPSPEAEALDTTAGCVLRATTSGFVRTINVDDLISGARRADAVVRLEVRPGDHVVRGAPIATLWRSGGVVSCEDEQLGDDVRQAVHLGFERTMEQDAAFGFRQLADIAVKALSPGINDPVTAVHAVGHLTDLMVLLAESQLGAVLHRDSEGTARAVVRDRDFRYYLDLACAQVRRYGAHEPTVLVALLRLLRDVGAASSDAKQRNEIARQADLVVASASKDLLPADQDTVADMRRRVTAVLDGDLVAAYADQAGETRSI